MKDGRVATFRDLKESDLPELVHVLNSVIREEVYLNLDKEIEDMEEERRWYHTHMKAGMTYIIARVDGKIVGGASIEPKKGKQAHVAAYGIFIKDGFRNIGVGTQLTKTLIEIARRSGFEIVELMVFASNKRALYVYEKFGFKEIGRVKNGIKISDGSYTDNIYMVLHLKN